MNKISHKINTYYELMSPQKSSLSPDLRKSVEVSFSQISNCEENHQKNSTPEVYFEAPNIEIASEFTQRNNTHRISPTQEPNEINKKVLRSSLLNSLEGFNAHVLVFEKRNEKEAVIFFSMIYSYLTYLKTAVENFKRDDITCVCRCSFFLCNGEKKIDLLRGLGAEEISFENKCEMIFFDINEMIEHFRKIVKNIQFKQGCQIYFQNSNLFYDAKENLSWKGKFSLSGFLLENSQSCSEYSEFYHSLFQGIKNKDCESNEDILDPNFEVVIREMKENSKICLYFAGDESSDFLEFFQNLDDFGGCSLKIQRNKLNEFTEYINTIYEQNRFLKQKESEISSIQMSLFLKTKENDELRLKIAQLESNLLYQKERKSFGSSNDLQSQKPFDYNEDETYKNLARLPSRRSEPELHIFPSVTQEKTSKLWIGLKSESSSNILFNSQNTKRGKPELIMEGYEEVLEINYYEEFASLKEKFLQMNKEFIKIQKEKNSYFEEIKKQKEEILEKEKNSENCKKEANEEKERFIREKERLFAKNKELQIELNDLYDVYNKLRFFKTKVENQ